MSNKIKYILFLLGPLFIVLAAFLELKPEIPRSTTLNAQKQSDTEKPIHRAASPLTPVVRVVDGDTIVVIVGGKEEKVRLIGINAPESVDPRQPVQCFGKEAGVHMRALIEGRNVRLTYDQSQDLYDKYGRLLAYVFRDDDLFINDAMIREGYAYEYTYSVPYFYQKSFKAAEVFAKTEKRGLWAAETCAGKL